ncbi:MAG: (p)ppGpp synthetase [Chloroflexi bacterium HGW-Chloroflexi-5]|jgi:ppGpp synthetase/RelA/SpoT-type nucleotidyltranferase|nr:MAG: (p)ppGpp synthetase [Chloroflexi bacterium HGW-Chloroflexi-5]
MAYSCVPKESKKQIIKAGEILISDTTTPEDYQKAYDLATQWRACHAYPINTFQSLLRNKLGKGNYGGEPIVAQRLKRMPTIIDKLKRYPTMNLVTMQDIGGVRAVLDSIVDVYKLRDEYLKCRFAHELIDQKDYILAPRSDDGYRSVHHIYKYKNVQNPNYDGLRLELQIRTKRQHLWATAVETMGTFLGQALKSRQGSQDWLDFFALISSAFAYAENTPPIPRFLDLSKADTSQQIAIINRNLGAVQKMQSLSVAVKYLSQKKGHSYHLIILDSKEKTVSVKSYSGNSLEIALQDYAGYEKSASEGRLIEPVLVSAGKIDMVRKAYPSFFLDISEFLRIVQKIITKKR